MKVVRVFTDHHVSPESGLSFVLRGQCLFKGNLDRVQVEVTFCGGVGTETAPSHQRCRWRRL